MSVALVQSHMTAAAVAIASGDHATARTNAEAALAYMAALPDTEKGDERLTWTSPKIELFLSRMDAGVSVAAGVQIEKVRWVPPDGIYEW